MGVRLIVEVLDYAPANLTPRERWTLVILAEGARDRTRVCWPGIEDDERFIRRSRLSRSQRYAVIKALIAKGTLENIRRGQKGVRAGYRIARLAPAGAAADAAQADDQGPENQDADVAEEAAQGPDLQDAEGGEDAIQGPVLQDAEPEGSDAQGPGFQTSGSRFSTFRVPVYGTPSPQSPQSPQKEEADASGADRTDGGLFADLDEVAAKRAAEKDTNRRINRLADHYCQLTKTADFHKTASAIRKTLTKGVGTEDEIEAALTVIATEGRFTLNADVLRVQISRAKNGTSGAPARGGARAEIPDNDYWDTITDDDLRNVL